MAIYETIVVPSGADLLEARLHQMDLTMQNLKTQMAGYDNEIRQLEVKVWITFYIVFIAKSISFDLDVEF